MLELVELEVVVGNDTLHNIRAVEPGAMYIV